MVMDRLLAALHRDGAVVLEGAAPPELCDALLEAVRPYAEDAEGGAVGAVAARSEHAWPLLAHPALLKLGEAVRSQAASDQSSIRQQNTS